MTTAVCPVAVWIDACGGRWLYDPEKHDWHEDTRPMDTTVVAAPARPAMTADDAIDRYVRLRDKKEALAKQHTEALRPYTDAMAALEAYLLGMLNASKVESMRANPGTAYKSMQTSVMVNEWSKTLDYIRENEAWELLEARVNKSAALEYRKNTGVDLPGTVSRSEIAVNVRRHTNGRSAA